MKYFEPNSINDALWLLFKHRVERKFTALDRNDMACVKFKVDPSALANITK
jgi:hypothetical protein